MQGHSERKDTALQGWEGTLDAPPEWGAARVMVRWKTHMVSILLSIVFDFMYYKLIFSQSSSPSPKKDTDR